MRGFVPDSRLNGRKAKRSEALGLVLGAIFAAAFLLNLGCAPVPPPAGGLCPYAACVDGRGR